VLTAHSCVLSWWAAVKGELAPGSWDRYRAEVARSLQSVDLITAPSPDMAVALNRYYGTDSSRCSIIPNGRNPARFHRGAKQPFVLTAGRLWDEAKNVAAVAQVAGSLSWPVYVAGEARSHLPGCRMLGRLQAHGLADWFTRASIYALPARYEPFGLSILEAALSGCALVLGDIASLRGIWGDAAIFVSPDDTEALRGALEMLIGDPRLRCAMSERAYRRAMEFGVTRMSDRYLDAYCSAVSTRVPL
jgi:glycogen(starch) synthase